MFEVNFAFIDRINSLIYQSAIFGSDGYFYCTDKEKLFKEMKLFSDFLGLENKGFVIVDNGEIYQFAKLVS